MAGQETSVVYLANNEMVAMGAIEIISVPDISIIGVGNNQEIVYNYKKIWEICPMQCTTNR